MNVEGFGYCVIAALFFAVVWFVSSARVFFGDDTYQKTLPKDWQDTQPDERADQHQDGGAA